MSAQSGQLVHKGQNLQGTLERIDKTRASNCESHQRIYSIVGRDTKSLITMDVKEE